MCGIAGLVSCGHPLDARLIKGMTDTVKYRGPDDEGFACWGEIRDICCLPPANTAAFTKVGGTPRSENVALGHRRLAIIDLSRAGHQPMAFHNQTLWIVFNGEIYNYRELRQRLQAQGCIFQSNSDTEVILAAYAQWGEQCVRQFNGMWAFSIYDSVKHSLFCSRDRFGVKPFYFARDDYRFGFASEIKQLRSAGFGTGRAQRSGVSQFLLYGNVNVNRDTLFEGIQQLLPGEALRWNISDGAGAVQTFRYYFPEVNSGMRPDGELEKYRESFQSLMQDSVEVRLRSDVPVGTCLSGGLDSSSIVITANRLLKSKDNGNVRQKTFTSCFHNPLFDEWNFASSVVSATDVHAHKVFPQMEQLWDELPQLTWHQDEPFGSTSIYAQWNVMRLVRDSGIKVLLDGQGADEVMAGYHAYILDYLSALFRGLQLRETIQSIRAMQKTGILQAAILSRSCSALDLLIRATRRLLQLPSLRPPTLLALFKSGYVAPNPDRGGTFQALLYDAIFGSLQSLLRYEDRNSMAFSVEARTPYLDYRIVELFLGMPGIYKVRDGWTKPFVREAMSGAMPDNVRLRVDKKGFVTPESIWIHNNLDHIRKVLLSSHTPIQLWIDQSKLEKWLLSPDCTTQGEFSLWRVISTHFWMEKFGIA